MPKIFGHGDGIARFRAAHVVDPHVDAAVSLHARPRTTRMVRLSSEGLDILETARKITATHEEGMLELDQRLRGCNNRVAVAAKPTLAASLIPLLIQSLARMHPQIWVEIYDPIASEALQLLRERRVDIAVITTTEEDTSDLVYQELLT